MLEEKHEETNSPKIEPLQARGKSLLQFFIINEATSISAHYLKAPNHNKVCP